MAAALGSIGKLTIENRDGHLLTKQKHRSVFAVFSLSFLAMLPFYFKGHQLILGDVPFAGWWNAFGWEYVFALSIYAGLVSASKWVCKATLVLAVLFNACMVLDAATYLQFGLFYKHGLLVSSNTAQLLKSGLVFITAELVLQLLGIVCVFTILHLPAVLCYRYTHLKRIHLFAISGCYLLLVAIWPPGQFQEQTMSLVATAKSFFPADDHRTLVPGVMDFPDFQEAPVQPLALPTEKRYNLVVYVMESTRAVSCSAYGSLAGTTPFLDSVRSKGLFFEQCYSDGVRSIKALSTLILGISPRHSVASWASLPMHNALGEKHLAGIFNSEGYYTAFFVNSHISFDNRQDFLTNLGFDEVRGADTFIALDDTPLIEQLKAHFQTADDQGQPLLSLLLASSGQRPYPYKGNHIPIADAEAEAERMGIPYTSSFHRYLNTIYHQDHVAGLISDYLKESGRDKDTIFVVLGNHGQTFGEHGTSGGFSFHGLSLFQESIHTPLWMSHPDLEPRIIEEPLQFLDLLPTWLAMTNIRVDQGFMGRNVLAEPRAKLFFANHAKWPATGVIEDGYKLIRHGAGLGESYFLYNLNQDPMERHNLGETHQRFQSLRLALEQADAFYPAVKARFQNRPAPAISKGSEAEVTTGLPRWRTQKYNETNLPAGYYVIPHIPDTGSPFFLDLSLVNKDAKPAPLTIELFDLQGRHIDDHEMALPQGETKIKMRQSFPRASYAILKGDPSIQASASLGGPGSVLLPYPLVTSLAEKITISGDVGAGNQAAFVFVNIQDHPDQVVLEINGDGGWSTKETLDLKPGEKRTFLFSTEEDRQVEIKISGDAIAHFLLRWDTRHDLFR